MKPFLNKKRGIFSRTRGVLVLFLIAIFFIVLNVTPASKMIKNFFYSISEPFQKQLFVAGGKTYDFFEAIKGFQNLQKENEELRLEIQELLVARATLEKLREENESLRTALNLNLEKDFQLKICQLIGKDISQDSLLLNVGSRDGVKIGLPVITEQKALVGKISEVYEKFSRVHLLTFKDNSFDVQVLGKEVHGLAKGKGNFQLFLDLIPQEKGIQSGDTIVTSALGGNFPEGLLVGKIERIKRSDIAPFQLAEIKLAFGIGTLNYLFVITNF